MLSALKQWFVPSTARQQAHAAYMHVVAQARSPVFFRDWQVDDTVDGRFDLIVVHASLLLMRLETELARADVEAFYQAFSEVFFADMDRSLREMGAGDTGVGIRVKNMAQAFYGRMHSYRDAMGDETLLAAALLRNVYRDRAVRPESVASLAAYMGRNHARLAQQSTDVLIAGTVAFSG